MMSHAWIMKGKSFVIIHVIKGAKFQLLGGICANKSQIFGMAPFVSVKQAHLDAQVKRFRGETAKTLKIY